jgi:lysophospholipase L1-like esterase
MKKKLLCVIMAAALLLGTTALNVSAQTIGPYSLLILGDSISTGYGLSGYPASAKSYGNQLASAFDLTGSAYTNLAVDGATSGDLLAALPNSAAFVAKANTIVISIGGNDVLTPFIMDIKTSLGLPRTATNAQLQAALAANPVTLAQIGSALDDPAIRAQFTAAAQSFGTNYASVIDGIRQANPTAKLYVQTVYNPFSGVPGYEALSIPAESIIGQMNNIITAGAAKANYTVLDIHAAFQGKAARLTNIAALDIHPNEAGHTAIFNAAYTAITGVAYTAPVTSSTTTPASSETSPSASSASPAASSNSPQSNPKTGDSTQLVLIASTLLVAIACAGLAVSGALKISAKKL